MKLMGIDYGRRRIGVAVTDETGTCVRGAGCIYCGAGKDAARLLQEYIDKEKPEALVVGLPLDACGEETDMSREIRVFAGVLQERTGLRIHFTDEQFSSKDAQRLAMHRSRKKRRDKTLVDRLAACLILEQYLRERV
jgi:putative Holliday junction resolvase